ncbi:nucleotidyltransferase domain-containing protein [Patescibacteria group bacterium]|nr:nucleotidyltransferase domain-containing protein [Patescibacteria group bacterium]MBU4481751.1 nucleotidyltransferase domain-containing protein [Patescibacteria group bacterium]
MTERKISQKIKEITEKIVKGFQPEKIILFGSWAWGKPIKDSDVDLFIIKNTRKDPIQRCYEVRKAIEPVVPLDILVFTSREVKNRLRLGDFFIKRILNQGKLLYGKRK